MARSWLRQEAAALRDLGRAYDRFNSVGDDRGDAVADVRFAPESSRITDIGGRLKCANCDLLRNVARPRPPLANGLLLITGSFV